MPSLKLTASHDPPPPRRDDRDLTPIPFPAPAARGVGGVSRRGRWDPRPDALIAGRATPCHIPHDAEIAVERAVRRLENLRHALGESYGIEDGPRAA